MLDVQSIVTVKNDGFKLKQGFQLAIQQNDGTIVQGSNIENELFKLNVNTIIEDIANKMVELG